MKAKFFNREQKLNRGAVPEHELSGLLASRLRQYERYLVDKTPEDLYQEVALFLLEHCPEEKDGEKINYKNLTIEEKRKIVNAFERHMHIVRKAEGGYIGRANWNEERALWNPLWRTMMRLGIPY